MGDRLQGLGQGGRAFGDAAQPHDGAGGMADLRLPLNPLAVLQLGPEPHVGVGGRHHLALHRQHPAGGGDGRFQAAGDGR